MLQKFEGKTSRELLAEQSGESHEQIRKYIRLTNLILELLDMVDNSVLKEKDKLQMALRPAVELSYLTEDGQKALLETITIDDCTPSHAQAIKMRDFSEKGKLNADVILSIMQEEKPNQKEKPAFKDERIAKLIPRSVPRGQETDFVVKALEFYNRHLQRQRSQER